MGDDGKRMGMGRLWREKKVLLMTRYFYYCLGCCCRTLFSFIIGSHTLLLISFCSRGVTFVFFFLIGLKEGGRGGGVGEMCLFIYKLCFDFVCVFLSFVVGGILTFLLF